MVANMVYIHNSRALERPDQNRYTDEINDSRQSIPVYFTYFELPTSTVWSSKFANFWNAIQTPRCTWPVLKWTVQSVGSASSALRNTNQKAPEHIYFFLFSRFNFQYLGFFFTSSWSFLKLITAFRIHYLPTFDRIPPLINDLWFAFVVRSASESIS